MKLIRTLSVFILLLFMQTANAQTTIVGDVNGDKKVDISDVVAIINFIARNDFYNSAADVNEDGLIDISDIVAVINIIANGDDIVSSGYCPDNRHPHLIDMGDAGLWSCCNLGADAPWKTGDFYAWGETETKEQYTWGNYIHCDGSQNTCHNLGDNIAGTDYDVVKKTMGGQLSIPTKDQAADLGSLTKEWTKVKGVEGYKITAKNGNKLFFPAGGYFGEEHYQEGQTGYYWTSSIDKTYGQQMAKVLLIKNGMMSLPTINRFAGCNIRPVVGEDNDPAVTLGYCPDSNHPHVIDMGSYGKWACCNVGATKPWEEGEHYAWGETEQKDNYTWENYTLCDGTAESCHDIGNDIAGTDYDVAFKKWGSTWNMPSYEQLYKLHREATSTTGKLKHVTGVTFTADNGNKVFFPACGHKRDGISYNPDPAIYWASTRKSSMHAVAPESNYALARAVSQYYGVYDVYNYARYYGGSVRAVSTIHDDNPDNPENPENPNVDQAVSQGYCPDENHPHVIDMGTAGKWACCNVGATAPWQTGGYYCWGGTKELSFYGATPENETACIWDEDVDGEGTVWWGYKSGMWNEDGVLHASYDVARVLWGGSWHMPTIDRYMLLNAEGFTKEKAWMRGTPGIRVNAPNGRRLFIPYCGKKVENEFRYDMYNSIEYWTANSITSFQGWCLVSDAIAMFHGYWYDPVCGVNPFDCNTDFGQIHQGRGFGLPVRAVQ